MTDYKEQIKKLTEIASNPAKSIAASAAAAGKEPFGYFPMHAPEEIIYAAGYLPVGMWGGKTEIKYADKYLQGFCCTIMKANMEFGITGVYNMLKGVLIPCFCDTLKCVCEDWKYAVPNLPLIPIVYPQNRNADGAMDFLVCKFQNVKSELEKLSGKEITEAALEKAFDVYEHYRSVMRKFTELISDYPLTFDAKTRHLVLKAAHFMDKAEYTAAVEDIMEQLSSVPKEEFRGIKVIATGLISEPVEVLDIFCENDIAVAGDDVSHQSRAFRTPSPESGSVLEKMAGRIAAQRGDTFLYEASKDKGDMLIEMVKRTKADGIVLFMMKFCDPEEFDYPILKKQAEAAGIPLLYLEVDQQMDSYEQLRTRIQSFAEMIG